MAPLLCTNARPNIAAIEKGATMRQHWMVSACLSALLCVGLSTPADAQFYEQHNIASDGAVPADHPTDTDLVNPWGLAALATSPWWISNNGTGKATLYNGNTGLKAGLVVLIAGAAGLGAPTGVVSYSGTAFLANGAASRFIFASEDGTISGWSGGTLSVVKVNKSGSAAVYKGLAIASTSTGDFLYATNFRAGTVDVFNSSWGQAPPSFLDPTIPTGYAPFGIQNVAGTIFVTYALQDADKEDDVPGEGHGFVNAFDTAGHLLYRVTSGGSLNSPWGIAMAPAGFGKFSGDLLIGNFGDGRIHAFERPASGNGEFEDHGPLHSPSGPPLHIEGLWAIAFGNGASAGPRTTLFFTAGPFDEEHGLFGSIVPTENPGHNR
jgi:uncharacterized protein (TIGR03118 family)